MIESDRVDGLGIEPEMVHTPTQSGKGQQIARCPHCKIAVWSHYSGSGPLTKFVRIGTLDNPDALPPDVHIFTSSKQPWVILPTNSPAFGEYYDRSTIWSKESLARFEQLRPHIDAYRRRVHDLMTNDLPPSIALYISAANENAAERVKECFAEDSTVRDEGRTYHGVEEIRQWVTDTKAKYRHTIEPLAVRTEGQYTVVTARPTGTFPGSPIEVPFRFALQDGKIARLQIG